MHRPAPTNSAPTPQRRWWACAVAGLVAGAILAACRAEVSHAAPARLADTGLYADFTARTLAADALPFAPQYPLWTDGAAKTRWIALPPGTRIDASDVDHWCFPIGTRLWKEFAFGRPVETRYMELLADGTWLYATYLWSADGADAVLAPDCGVRRAAPTADGCFHDVPSQADCHACHEGARVAVLGFNALQLSSDRDPGAPHADPHHAGQLDLEALVARDLIEGLPAAVVATPPRIAARSARERAAVGYLFGNCSSCHNSDGPLARLGLRFDHPLGVAVPPARTTTVGVRSEFASPGVPLRIAPGDPEHSLVVRRVAATDAILQMPPFGRHLADRDAFELLADWVTHDLAADVCDPTVRPESESK